MALKMRCFWPPIEPKLSILGPFLPRNLPQNRPIPADPPPPTGELYPSRSGCPTLAPLGWVRHSSSPPNPPVASSFAAGCPTLAPLGWVRHRPRLRPPRCPILRAAFRRVPRPSSARAGATPSSPPNPPVAPSFAQLFRAKGGIRYRATPLLLSRKPKTPNPLTRERARRRTLTRRIRLPPTPLTPLPPC